MTINRMLGLRHRLRGLANPVPSGPRARISPPSPPLPARLLDCGWCYEENGEEVHPHPECPIGQPAPRAIPALSLDRLVDRHADDLLALSEANGRIARTVTRLERVAAELEARHVRYAWTEGLRQELLAIAHDTSPEAAG